jgi:Bacterial transcriptional regulator
VRRRCRVRPARRPRRADTATDARAVEPTHATGRGEALLAHRSVWRDSMLAQPLRRYTPRTLTDPREPNVELGRARTRGYATDNGEHRDDVRAIAAPVFQAGDAVAAITASLTAEESQASDPGALAANTWPNSKPRSPSDSAGPQPQSVLPNGSRNACDCTVSSRTAVSFRPMRPRLSEEQRASRRASSANDCAYSSL